MTTPTNYPPKNRRASALPDWMIEIVDADGIKSFDPIGLLIYTIKHGDEFLKLKPIKGLYSDVSNQGAVLYRSYNVELAVSPEELYRICAYALHRNEYEKLRQSFGNFREIDREHYVFKYGAELVRV